MRKAIIIAVNLFDSLLTTTYNVQVCNGYYRLFVYDSSSCIEKCIYLSGFCHEDVAFCLACRGKALYN